MDANKYGSIRVHSRYPRLLIQLISGDARRCFEAAYFIDLNAIVAHALRHALQYVLREILCGRLQLIERRQPQSPQDIAELQLIEAETGALGWADWFGRLGHPLPPQARFARFEQMFFALEAALDGLGVALLPSALVLDDIAAGRLTVALKVTGFHERDYYSLCSPLTRQAELSEAFVAWLAEEGADSNRLAELIIAP